MPIEKKQNGKKTILKYLGNIAPRIKDKTEPMIAAEIMLEIGTGFE